MQQKGRSPLDCAKNNDIYEIEAECGGGSHAQRATFIFRMNGWINLTHQQRWKNLTLLDFAIDVKENSRLSCQIKIDKTLDGITIQTPEKQF